LSKKIRVKVVKIEQRRQGRGKNIYLAKNTFIKKIKK